MKPLSFVSRALPWLGALLLTTSAVRALETTWIYSVQATAVVQNSPPQITLQWPAETHPVTAYTITRKVAGTTTWGAPVVIAGTSRSYTDTNVSVGTLYEYQIFKQGGFFTGYGYIAAGIDVPLIEARGKIILIVDNTHASTLAPELLQLQRDLVGDGWTVVRRDVARSATPQSVRDIIRAEYNADPANTRAVLLFGRVPIAKSGNVNIDGHGARPLPSDAYYGDIDGNWGGGTGGLFEPNALPSDVELQVGRIDLAELPAGRAAEAVLLQQYLFKNHDYRHARRRIAARALIGDRFGDSNGQAYSAAAYRNFTAFVGPGAITQANTEDVSPAAERWVNLLAARDYLWAYAGGGGSDNSIGYHGTRGQFFDVTSEDLVQARAKGTFYLMFGSWFVDWSKPDNILRAALAVPDYGLAAAWSGRPHLYFHWMSMGETLGHGIRMSQNNTVHYTNEVNRQTRGIHIALMGDPTLRLHVVAPPSNLTSTSTAAGEELRWTASSDAVAGYHVYRASSPEGPFGRVTTSLVTGTSYTDTTVGTGSSTYMVRAVRLERSQTGTYFNASQGIFRTVSRTSAGSDPRPATALSAPAIWPTPTTNSVSSSSAGSGGGSGGGGGGGGGGAPHGGVAILLATLLLARRLFTKSA